MVKDACSEMSRNEFRVEIPVLEAETLLERYCKGMVIEKTRFILDQL